MKTWDVSIPVLVRDADKGLGRDTKEYAMAVSFEVEAETATEAARILRERLEPTCGDPG